MGLEKISVTENREITVVAKKTHACIFIMMTARHIEDCHRDGYASVMVAVDPSSKANGCLQVLKGSHRLG